MPFDGQQVNVSGPAAGAIGRGILVVLNSSGQWAIAGDGVDAMGVTLESSAAAGDIINVAMLNGARLEIQADAALATIGTAVASSADGQAAAAAASEVIIGYTMSVTGAAGEIVDVLTVRGHTA